MATSPRPRRVAASALHGSLVLIAEGYGSAREKADREIASLEAGPSPGYVDALVSIVSARGDDAAGPHGPRAATAARLLASICLKNVAAKRWRPQRGRGEPLDEDEKARCRAWLCSGERGGALEEQDRRVAAQLQLCLRKVVKADWPRAWPEAPRGFLEAYAAGGRLARESLMMLGAVVKELARKVLPGDRRAFAQASRELLPPLAALLETAASSLLQAAAGGRENDDEALEATTVLCKTASRLALAADLSTENGGAEACYGAFLRLDVLACEGNGTADPRWRRKLQCVVVPARAFARDAAAFARFAAPFLERAVDALERTPLHDRLTAAGAVARLDLCGTAVDAAADVDACGRFVAAGGPRLARWCLESGVLALSVHELAEWEDDAEEHALRADDADDARPRGLDGDDDGGFDRGDVDDGGDEPGGTGDGARSVRAAAERLLLGLLDASRRSPQPSGLEAAVLDGAVGARAAEALLGAVDRVSSSPDALRRLGKEELAHFRGFFARAEAGLRAGGVAAGALADALPDDAPQRVRRWIGGALPRLLRGLRNAALAPPVALHVNFSTHVVLAAVRRRLYWFARCWAFALYDAPELVALVCGEASADAAEGDAAVALGALETVRCFCGFAAFSAESAALPALAAAVGRARTFALPDHVEVALHCAEACGRRALGAASATPAVAVAVAEAFLGHVEALYAEATADVPAPPSLLGALADAARVGVVAARAGGAVGAVVDRAAALVSALCDAARDPELCCAGPGLRLWLELVRSFDGQAPVPASLSALARLAPALVAPPRDLALAVDVCQVVEAYCVLGPERLPRESLDALAGPLVALAGEVNWRANRDVDKCLEASLAWCPAVALAALGRDDFKAIKLLARDALEARVPDAVKAQHLAVLARCLCRDAAAVAAALGEGLALDILRAFLDRAHVRGDALSVDDVARAAPGDGVRVHRAKMGALAALRLAALGDGLFLSQLDATLTLVNEALRLAAASAENPMASPVHLARAPRVSGRGDRADGLDGVAEVGTDDDDDAALVFPLDTLSAWRVGHDWAQVDLAAVARQALADASARVGPAVFREALDAVDAAILGQLGFK